MAEVSICDSELSGVKRHSLGFQCYELAEGHAFLAGQLPAELLAAISFPELWDLHPPAFPEIRMHGHRVKIPRWQQA